MVVFPVVKWHSCNIVLDKNDHNGALIHNKADTRISQAGAECETANMFVFVLHTSTWWFTGDEEMNEMTMASRHRS